MNQESTPQPSPDAGKPQAKEELLWQGHPSHWRFFGRYLLTAILVVGGSALAIWQHLVVFLLVVGLVLVGLGLIVLLAAVLERLSTQLTVTTRTVSYESGIISRDITDLPVHSITEIKVEQSFMQRLLGIGTVGLSSSASSDTEIVCRGMPRPQRIRDILKKAGG